jgi:hypothetical protein
MPVLLFTLQWEILKSFLHTIDEVKSQYRYAEGKWTIKELLQHIIDSERIFAYRALAIARGDQQPLPGFDEEIYAANSGANNRKWQDLVDEFFTVRITTMQLFHSFSKAALEAKGIANKIHWQLAILPISLLAIVFTIKKFWKKDIYNKKSRKKAAFFIVDKLFN